MYPQKFRDEVVQAYKNGEGSYRALEQRFGVPARTINRWVKHNLNPRTPIKMGRPPRFNEESLELLQELKKAHPELTLTKLAQLYAQQTGTSVPANETMRDAMHKLGYHYKRTQKSSGKKARQAVGTFRAPSETKVDYRYREEHRQGLKNHQKRAAYPSDLSDAQWALLEPLFEKKETRGRKRQVALRELLNAIFYVLRTGCQWRYLPHDFPKWTLVAKTFYRLKESGQWQQIHDTLRERARVKAGREPTPSASIIDSQSSKTTEKGGTKGFDAGKKSKAENVIFS